MTVRRIKRNNLGLHHKAPTTALNCILRSGYTVEEKATLQIMPTVGLHEG